MRNASESMPRMGRRTGWWVLAFAVLLSGCGVNPQKVTVPVVPAVDLQRFMGPWYVIAVIPTFIEKDIYNAVESYELAPDGAILTNYTETIIARSARDYVWIMARTPTIDEARYRELVGKVGAMGYDVNKLVRISHRTAAGR